MDGTIDDHFRNGRRLRPASLEYARNNFPRLIQRLLQNHLHVTSSSFVGGPDIVTCRNKNPSFRQETWTIVRADFELCRKISQYTSLKTFVSDTEQTTLEKIKARVIVEFSGRGVPDEGSSGNVCL